MWEDCERWCGMSNEKYVIYLSSELDTDSFENAYGYWSGKNYIYEGELFPITDRFIGKRTKIYSSRKRAENALESALNKGYAYVASGRIEGV